MRTSSSTHGPPSSPAGATLLDEARALLDRAERVRVRVAAAFRRRHPGVEIRIRETDLTDPTCGLRAGLVDLALTRAPFDETGLNVFALRADPVGALLRADDLLARHDRLALADLADRRWFRFPDGTDALWQAYWNGGEPREGPVVRAVQECVQAVLWNGTVGLAPLGHDLPGQLTVVPLADMAPSRVVVAANEADTNPLIRSFVRIATAAYRD
ncbi:substrate-binding domain-containing protein [Streptomyces sp. NPDC048595]|uniref:substrate-binding domain-containing protein n=1 Tax=Streptomyces sp. NPDC048595 TaxID=3365576 RepID=UPI00372394C8